MRGGVFRLLLFVVMETGWNV